MDKLKQYVSQARQQNMADEDIVLELSKVGWSIPDIHQAMYNPNKSSRDEMFAKNPLLLQHQANQAAQQALLQQRAAQMVQEQPATQVVARDVAPPAIQQTHAAPEQTKPKHNLRKILLFSGIGVVIFVLGVFAGLGGGYLYLKRQLAAFGGGAFSSGIGASGYETDISQESTEGVTEETTDAQDKQKQNSNGDSSGQEGSSSSSESGGSSSGSGSSSSGSSKKSNGGGSSSSCKSSTSTPSGVCAAIYSVVDNFSSSNPYLSHYEGQFPSGADVLSASEDSWSSTGSNQGTVFGLAKIPPLGEVPVVMTLKKIDGQWKVTNITI